MSLEKASKVIVFLGNKDVICKINLQIMGSRHDKNYHRN